MNKSNACYRKTRKGISTKIYNHQLDNSKKRNHEMPDYSLNVFRQWLLNHPKFETIFNAWVVSGYDKSLKPSADRLDDYKPYTLSNLRLVTWQENNDKACADRRNGINNKASKAVLQLTKEGIVFAEYHSQHNAGRETGLSQGNIGACCRGQRKTTGGFVWCFA